MLNKGKADGVEDESDRRLAHDGMLARGYILEPTRNISRGAACSRSANIEATYDNTVRALGPMTWAIHPSSSLNMSPKDARGVQILDHAAISHSWIRLPRRPRRWTRGTLSRSATGSALSGAQSCSPRCQPLLRDAAASACSAPGRSVEPDQGRGVQIRDDAALLYSWMRDKRSPQATASLRSTAARTSSSTRAVLPRGEQPRREPDRQVRGRGGQEGPPGGRREAGLGETGAHARSPVILPREAPAPTAGAATRRTG